MGNISSHYRNSPPAGSWIDELPTLAEPLSAGHDDVWRARLGNGHEVLAERTQLAGPEEVRRLADLDSPHLPRLLGAAARGGQTWLIWQHEGAVPAARLLSIYSFTPGQAVAAICGLLAALADLQASGRNHGAIESRNLLVGPDGSVRLIGFTGTGSSAAADMQAAGALACSLLGIPVQAGGRLHRSEVWVPALAVQARALATGGMGDRAHLALGLIQDAAGRLASPEGLRQNRAELGGMARQSGGALAAAVQKIVPLRAAQSSAPPPPASRRPVPTQPPRGPVPPRLRPAQHGWRPAAAVLAAGLGLLILSIVWLAGFAHRPMSSPAPPPRSQVSGAPAGRVPVSAAPTAPLSAGDVQAVKLSPQGQCEPGASCGVRVDVTLNRLPYAAPVSYVFQVRDRCSGTVSELSGSSIPAQQGWTSAWGVSPVSLPNGRALELTAITTSPARAASPPLTLGPGC